MTDQNNAPERIWLTDSEAELFGCYDHDFNGEGHISYTLTDRAAPEGQVDREQVVQLCLKIAADRRAQAAGDATVDQKRRSLAGAIQAEIIAEQVRALTPPPAAPTDNTALVDVMEEALKRCLRIFEHHGIGGGLADDIRQILAAFASREAPPAAQEPVAWQGPGEKPHEYSPDYMAMGDCRICGHDYEAHHPSPPACQQEAVTVAEEQSALAAAPAEIKRLKRELEITHNSRNELAETWKDRAIKAEAERDEARILASDRLTVISIAAKERDEARSMLADAERDMRQRAADVCAGYANDEKLKPAKGWSDDEVKHWETGGVDHLLAAMDAIFALPLKHADREGGV
ncbi:hypothetical protein A6J80_03080 [Paracoccus yeei]|uniref:Uncharacterized protein n=1 Tax=Paracoccus yeei TaxID=147645 RepID=A0A1V0GNR4_9RHOB|nr:hypothetical protein [Paracoccus yeei]ARC35497.1 hypothetical protein A6J80_03080 [Paracoccus yeei]